jgi:hypothetical protein
MMTLSQEDDWINKSDQDGATRRFSGPDPAIDHWVSHFRYTSQRRHLRQCGDEFVMNSQSRY